MKKITPTKVYNKYTKETGQQPIYRGKHTVAFQKWLKSNSIGYHNDVLFNHHYFYLESKHELSVESQIRRFETIF